MICKNCANIFSDDLDACPECNTPIKNAEEKKEINMEEFLSSTFGEFEDISSVSEDFQDDSVTEEENQDEVTETQESEKEEESAENVISSSEETMAPAEETADAEKETEEEKIDDKQKVQPPQQRERRKMKKMNAKEKGAVSFIVSLMVVVFVAMGALIGISIGTDVFEKDEDSMMTMALSGLSPTETNELEEYLSKISVVAYNGFDREVDVIVDVMEFLRPYDGKGLYSSFYGAPELTVNEADPNGRFANENGDYSFYALDAEKVDSILYSFGFDINHNVNEKNFYYYDGKYYFANIIDEDFGKDIVADISSSKRIQDGSYYVECSFFDKEATDEGSSYLKAYIILDKNSKAKENEFSWQLSRISHNPIFDETGIMIKDTSGRNELSYSIEHKTIEAVTEDGVVYAQYNLEYPLFKGNTEGEKAVNRMFSELVNNYTLQAEDPTEDYNNFIKKGGDEKELPFITHAVARVTYNRNGYISIVEGLSNFKPQAKKKTASSQEEVQFVELPERTVEGYILEVETGDFVSKKEVLEAQYHLVYEVIYRIYNGYDYESLLKGEDVAIGIPADAEETGKNFYESACALSENGFIFCRVHPKGYTETVIIPYSAVNFFSSDFSKLTNDNK